MALLRGEVAGQFHADGGEQVAAPFRFAQVGHTLSSQSETASVLGFGGQGQFDLAAQGGYGDGAAEHGVGEGGGDGGVEVGALALKAVVGEDGNGEVEFAAGAPAGGDMDASAVDDAGGNGDFEAAAVGQVDLAGSAVVGLLQGDVNGDVGGAGAEPFAEPGETAGHAAEEVGEGFGGGAGGKGKAAASAAEIGASGSAAAVEKGAETAVAAGLLKLLSAFPLVAVAVVFGALVGVRQDFVGGVDGLEPLGGVRVARVDVRVMLPGEAAVGLPDFLVVGAAGNAEGFVVVGHGDAP